MPKYEVQINKPVADILRTFIAVEADSVEDARAKALDKYFQDTDAYDESFTFWQVSDSPDDIVAAEVTLIGESNE